MAGRAVRVGVLALQGAFREHCSVLEAVGVDALEIRRPDQLADIDGLVIPGGESTTIRLLMADFGLVPFLHDRLADGLPVLGTCAGLIVLARTVDDAPGQGLDALNVSVRRNAFGRQVDSFEEDLVVPALGAAPFHGVFIRAPLVESVGPDVQVLAELAGERIVAVRQNSIVGLAFHPELTPDHRFHQFFVDIVRQHVRARTQAPYVVAEVGARAGPGD